MKVGEVVRQNWEGDDQSSLRMIKSVIEQLRIDLGLDDNSIRKVFENSLFREIPPEEWEEKMQSI